LDERDRYGIEVMIGSIIRFFNGGITYNDLINMPIPEIYKWFDIAKKINKEEEKQINKDARKF
jgi:hypothetical protein